MVNPNSNKNKRKRRQDEARRIAKIHAISAVTHRVLGTTELLELILDYISPQELLHCTEVCKYFQTAIEDSPALWTILQCIGPHRDIFGRVRMTLLNPLLLQKLHFWKNVQFAGENMLFFRGISYYCFHNHCRLASQETLLLHVDVMIDPSKEALNLPYDHDYLREEMESVLPRGGPLDTLRICGMSVPVQVHMTALAEGGQEYVTDQFRLEGIGMFGELRDAIEETFAMRKANRLGAWGEKTGLR